MEIDHRSDGTNISPAVAELSSGANHITHNIVRAITGAEASVTKEGVMMDKSASLAAMLLVVLRMTTADNGRHQPGATSEAEQ